MAKKQDIVLGAEEASAALQLLAQLFNLQLRTSDASVLLAKVGTVADLARELKPLGVRAEAPKGDLAEVTRRGPVLLMHDGKPSMVLGVRGETAGVLELGAKAPTEVPAAQLKGGLQFLRQMETDESPEAFGWRWFSKAFFAKKRAVTEALVLSLVVQLIALAFPLATQAVVDKVITNQAVNTLVVLGSGIALLALFSGVLSWVRQKLMLRLANQVDGELAQQVFDRLMRLPLPFFEQRATGVIINRIHGVERVREFFAGAFLLGALELPFMLVFLALMLSYSTQLSLVVLGFLAVMVTVSFAVGPVLRRRFNTQAQLGAKLQGFMTEHVAAAETVKALQLEGVATRKFAELNHEVLAAGLSTRELGNAYGSFMQLAEQLMNAAVLCLGAYLAMTPGAGGAGLTIGMLVAFQMFASKVTQPLLKLSGYWQELQQVRTAVAMLGDVMNAPAERFATQATSAGVGQGKLEVTGLGFRYEQNRPMLYEGFDFSVAPGEVVLITGPSGCGKSTLAKILLGLYANYQGVVKVDGRDARSMGVNELRASFGVVPQEAVLFAGTILENLLAGAPGCTLEHAVQACKLAGVHEAIENLPEGYQTKVGERGVGLSGGQRQRVAIARALLKRPKVLVFDEATSGLDEASAEVVAQTVNSLRGKVSMLFIAHKVPASLKVDRHVRLGGREAVANVH